MIEPVARLRRVVRIHFAAPSVDLVCLWLVSIGNQEDAKASGFAFFGQTGLLSDVKKPVNPLLVNLSPIIH